MFPPVVWLNKYLSNTWEIMALLREVCTPDEFRILCSHPWARYPGGDHSDVFEQEPKGLGEEGYVNYCLDVVRRHGVRLFLPGRKLLPILRAREQFESPGARVLASADADTVALLGNKARLYAALDGLDVHIPDYEVIHDLAGFDAAWARLRPRHSVLCYKPAVSVYGLGFHIVVDDDPAFKPRRGDAVKLPLEDARRGLAREDRLRDLLLMQYLPGPERSVDCLALDGELLRCVVRRKEAGGQVLEDNPELAAVVRRLTRRFRLTHLFNVQFRDSGGKSYLLEINTRMSGGLPFACRSGLVLPYWAIRLALGTASPEEIPQPRTGIWVPQPEPVSSQ